MATIPAYRGPQVRAEAMPDGFQRQAGNDAPFGGIAARQTTALGDAAQRAGAQFDQIAERRALESAFDIENKIAEEWQVYESDLRKTRQGEKATGVRADSDAWWTQTAERYGRELDPTTKRALSKSLGRMRVQALGRADAYETDQLDRVGQVAYETSQGREAQDAAGFGIAGNQAELATSLSKMESAARQYLVRKGMPAEAVAEEVRKLQGKVHGDVVVGLMLGGKAKEARDYFNQPGVQEAFTRTQRAELGERLAKLVEGDEGAAGAREVFTSNMGGKSYHEAVPYDTLDAALVKRFDGKPEALKAARSELDRQVALWNRTQTERQSAGVQGAYDMLNKGVGFRQIQASPAWAQMAPQQRDQFREMLDNRWRAAEARTLADRERAERAEEARTAEAMLTYADPRNLSKLSREEVLALRPALGEKNWSKLAKEWDGYQRDQVKLSNATFDNDMFGEVMLNAGYDPKPKAGNKEAAATVIRARNAIESAVAVEQKAKGRELTAQEKRAVAQGVVAARVMIDRPWMPDREVALFEASPQELSERGYIEVGPKKTKLMISDVPAQDFADMKRYLRETGQPNDDITVMQRWWEYQQRKVKK